MEKLNTNNRKTKRIASAFAALSIISAMSMPAATIYASAAEDTSVIAKAEDTNYVLDGDTKDAAVPEITDSAAVNTGERGSVTAIQNSKLEKAIKAASKKTVSYSLGKIPVCGDALNSVFEGICGLLEEEAPSPATVEEIDKLLNKYNDELKDVIESRSDRIMNEISSVSEINNFYSPFVEFVGQVDYLEEEINAIKDYDISENRKLFKIGELIGKKDTWADTNTVFGHMNTIKANMNKTGMLSNQNIFEALYKHYEKDAMFSIEAKKKAQDAVEYIYAKMIYGYTLTMECLSAQLQVIQLQDKSEFDSAELNTICRDAEDIITRMLSATSMTFGDEQLVDEVSTTVWFTDIMPEQREGRKIERICYSEHNLVPPGTPENGGYYGYYGGSSGPSMSYGYKVTDTMTNTVECLPKDSLSGMLDNFNKIYDLTYVNKGKANVKLSKDFATNGFSTYGSDALKRIVDIQPIAGEDIMNIVKYAAEKNMTPKEFLASVGFNTDCITDKSLFCTGDVWNDHNFCDDLVQTMANIVGFDRLDIHYFIRVLNPNVKNASKQDKQYRSYGFTRINFIRWSINDEWNYVEKDMKDKILVLFKNV